MRKTLGLVCGVAAVVLFLIPTGNIPQPPIPPDDGKTVAIVDQAFDTYKRLWVDLNLKAAEKLDSKEFETSQQVWEFIANGQEACRKVAFKEIAEAEQKVLGTEWTPEKHSSLLKGYSK